jgi:CheY-like chemotaxis protein
MLAFPLLYAVFPHPELLFQLPRQMEGLMSDKLLLADDSITIQKVVGIIFANEDYHLTVVDNGNAALGKAREIVPDIILADVVMPGKTGYEVCAEIRRDPALAHVPLLLLSGAFEPFDEEKAKQSGADDFISKPFESQQLIEKVKKLLELGKQRKSAGPVREAAVVAAPRGTQASIVAPFTTAPVGEEMGGLFFEVEEIGGETELPAEQLDAMEELVDAFPEDDLWGAFELEEVGEGDDAEFEAVLDEEEVVEPFGEFEIEEEEYSFAEEEEPTLLVTLPETAGAPPLETGTPWAPDGEETLLFEEAAGTETLELAAEEEPFNFEIEEAPLVEPAMGGVFEYAAEPHRAAPAVPEVELQFAPEEKYVPVFAAVGPAAVAPVASAASVAARPAVYGEQTLSEEQLASIVTRISRDIIEKIAWEVIPDLAETLIREEIRKIKEGQ